MASLCSVVLAAYPEGGDHAPAELGESHGTAEVQVRNNSGRSGSDRLLGERPYPPRAPECVRIYSLEH